MLKVLICLVKTKIIPIFVALKEVYIQKKAEYLTLDIQPFISLIIIIIICFLNIYLKCYEHRLISLTHLFFP